MTKAKVEAIKKGLRKKKKRPEKKRELLSTGSTLLNLACSGDPMGGLPPGYVILVGDSDSGKTFLSLTCLAEASINPAFDKHRFIYDPVEGGALMDFGRFFGKAVARRIEYPGRDQGSSETIEGFYFNIDEALKDGRPFIWILDSMDALSSDYEGKKFEERKKAHAGNTQAKGSYGDGKAKVNSQSIRRLLTPLVESGSILIIISQTRDKIDAMPFESKKTSSGGRSLKFYATFQLWSSSVGAITKQIKGKKRELGIRCRVAVKKNRLVGRKRVVEIPLYHSYGIDDVGSCVEYLIDEDHWKKDGRDILATGIALASPTMMFRGTQQQIIQHVEENNLEGKLRRMVGEVWNEIEKACELKRRKRYEGE